MSAGGTSRRRFLADAAAVTGAVLGVASLPRAAAAMSTSAHSSSASGGDPVALDVAGAVRLGVASYSLRNLKLDAALDAVKALRTPFVNFKSVHVPYEKSPQELAALRQRIEGAGFRIVGGGTIDFTIDTDDGVRRYFDYARAAGMPLIVATCAPAVLPRIEKFARQYDIKVALHNHGPEDTHYPSPYDVLRHVEGMDPRMGLCMDVGHSARTGVDLVKAIRDAGPRLLDMHAKDLRDATEKDSQCIVGEGVLPFPAMFQALMDIRYAGYVNLEYEIDADNPLPGMKQSFAYMRGVLAGLAR